MVTLPCQCAGKFFCHCSLHISILFSFSFVLESSEMWQEDWSVWGGGSTTTFLWDVFLKTLSLFNFPVRIRSWIYSKQATRATSKLCQKKNKIQHSVHQNVACSQESKRCFGWSTQRSIIEMEAVQMNEFGVNQCAIQTSGWLLIKIYTPDPN